MAALTEDPAGPAAYGRPPLPPGDAAARRARGRMAPGSAERAADGPGLGTAAGAGGSADAWASGLGGYAACGSQEEMLPLTARVGGRPPLSRSGSGGGGGSQGGAAGVGAGVGGCVGLYGSQAAESGSQPGVHGPGTHGYGQGQGSQGAAGGSQALPPLPPGSGRAAAPGSRGPSRDPSPQPGPGSGPGPGSAPGSRASSRERSVGGSRDASPATSSGMGGGDDSRT